MIDDLLEGQYNDPVRILVLHLTASWVRGASDEIARKLRQRCVNEGGEVPDFPAATSHAEEADRDFRGSLRSAPVHPVA